MRNQRRDGACDYCVKVSRRPIPVGATTQPPNGSISSLGRSHRLRVVRANPGARDRGRRLQASHRDAVGARLGAPHARGLIPVAYPRFRPTDPAWNPIVRYSKEGYLPADRHLQVPWQDYAHTAPGVRSSPLKHRRSLRPEPAEDVLADGDRRVHGTEGSATAASGVRDLALDSA